MAGMDGIIPFAVLSQSVSNLAAEVNPFSKGVVDSVSDLPASGELGDMYMVASEGYILYVWDGTQWVKKRDEYGNIIDFNVVEVTS